MMDGSSGDACAAPGNQGPVPNGSMVGPVATHGLAPAALDALMPLHLVLSPEGLIQSVGRTIPKLFDLAEPDTLLGRSFFDLFDVRRPRAAQTLRDLLASDRGRLRIIPRHKDAVPLKGIAVPMSCGYGLIDLSFGISGIDAIQRHGLTAGDFAHTNLTIELLYLHEANTAALSEGKRLNQKLKIAHAAAERRALTDALTGLKNRRGFEQLVERLISEGAPFAMIHLDLDKFKYVNDTYGHAAGDEVLQSVSSRLSELVRGTDTVARMGGDEFVLIMSNTTLRDPLSSAASRIIAGLEKPIAFNGHVLEVSASLGITISTNYETPSSDQMQHDADMALYQSKRDGRGRFTFFTDVPDADDPSDVAGADDR